MTNALQSTSQELLNFWDRIKAALEPDTAVPAEVEHQLRLATGALLLEMCHADFKVMRAEQTSIARAIKQAFNLTAEETRTLVQEAASQSECAVSLQIYTSLLNDYATRAQKVRLISDLWRVAFADGELHRLEEILVSRVATLMGISAKQVQQIRLQIENGAPPDSLTVPL